MGTKEWDYLCWQGLVILVKTLKFSNIALVLSGFG